MGNFTALHNMKITEQHTVEGGISDPITGGGEMKIRRCVVIHHTAGATAKSSSVAMRQRGVSAHVVIDRDGTIYQCRPFDVTAGHAGESRWKDPKTGRLYVGCNGFSIGIEIANAGDEPTVIAWAKKNAAARSIMAKHANGGKIVEWEVYPDAQLKAVFALTQALVTRYHLDDITGHECVAPERKRDPGPAFPMLELRDLCGFGKTLPVTHWK